MTSRLLHLHFKMSRLALVSWALALFVLGAFSVFRVPEMPAYGLAHLPSARHRFSCLLPHSLCPDLLVRLLVQQPERRHVLLTLGTLPLRRRHTALGKSMFFALAVAGLAFVGWASSALAVAIVEADISIERLALSTAVGYLLVMTVFSYTLIASAMCSNQRTSLALAAVITFIAYLAEVIGSGYEGLKWLASASIFHYYDPSELLQERDRGLARE